MKLSNEHKTLLCLVAIVAAIAAFYVAAAFALEWLAKALKS